MGDTLETRIADLRVEADLLELLAKKRDVVTDISYNSSYNEPFKISGKYNNFKYEYQVQKDGVTCTVNSNQDVVRITVKKDALRKISSIRINDEILYPCPDADGDSEILQSLITIYDCVAVGNKIKIPVYTSTEDGETPKLIPEVDRENLSMFLWAWEMIEKVEAHLHNVIPEFFQIIENYKSGNYSPRIVETPVQLRTKEDVMNAFDMS